VLLAIHGEIDRALKIPDSDTAIDDRFAHERRHAIQILEVEGQARTSVADESGFLDGDAEQRSLVLDIHGGLRSSELGSPCKDYRSDRETS